VIVQLFTEQLGRISALARAARNSRRRFGGSLEPIHTLFVSLDEREHHALLALREASIVTVRDQLASSLERLSAAGKALGWVRAATPEHTAEPAVWKGLTHLLDRLQTQQIPLLLAGTAEFGLQLIRALGFGIDFERCVRCGGHCGPKQAVTVDPVRGGLVCRPCGGARIHLDSVTRARLLRVARGESDLLSESDAAAAMDLVEQGLQAHAGVS
jgi:DNA repair protein RecO (recombination protein O)